MAKVTMLIPTKYNDGRRVEKEKIQWFVNEIIKLTGGITRDGIVKGWWQGEKLYEDINIKYFTVTDDTEAIRAVMLEAKKVFEQEAMYFEIDNNTNIEFL